MEDVMMDMSDYLISSFREKWGEGVFEKIQDEDGTPLLHVQLPGMVDFEIDLEAAEHAILEENVDPDDYVMTIIEVSKIDSGDDSEFDLTFEEISDAMSVLFETLIDMEIDHTIGGGVESTTRPDMVEGLWVNIGIHPVPFIFLDVWLNIVFKEIPAEEYIKSVIIKHVGKLPM